MIIGSHCGMNAPEYFLGSVKEALGYGATALMIYTGAPQSSLRRPVSELRINEAQALLKESNICLNNVIIHAPYILNPATNDPEKHDFCIEFLAKEIKRSFYMGSKIMVLHPGNKLEQETNAAIGNVIDVLNQVLELTKDTNVVIAIETMAGKGSEVGITFNEVKKIIDGVSNKDRIGVCFDTCHVNDSGYDLVNNYDGVKEEFKRVIGLEYLKVIHVNDSKNPMGARKDRHANIGDGFIGYETLRKVCHDSDFELIPKILETPYVNGNPPYKMEIEMLKK